MRKIASYQLTPAFQPLVVIIHDMEDDAWFEGNNVIASIRNRLTEMETLLLRVEIKAIIFKGDLVHNAYGRSNEGRRTPLKVTARKPRNCMEKITRYLTGSHEYETFTPLLEAEFPEVVE